METPSATPTPKHLTRTGIMKALFPKVVDGLQSIEGLDANNLDHIRRVFRALLTMGIRLMLDAKVPPQLIMNEAALALTNELKERAAKAKEDGATQAPPSLPS